MPPVEEPLIAGGVRCHGGYVGGEYVSPRSAVRRPAIEAWRQRLLDDGHPLIHVPEKYVPPNYPNYPQAKYPVEGRRGRAGDARADHHLDRRRLRRAHPRSARSRFRSRGEGVDRRHGSRPPCQRPVRGARARRSRPSRRRRPQTDVGSGARPRPGQAARTGRRAAAADDGRCGRRARADVSRRCRSGWKT